MVAERSARLRLEAKERGKLDPGLHRVLSRATLSDQL
jgi:hypothetical protein